MVFILKPGKESYKVYKSWRGISYQTTFSRHWKNYVAGILTRK